ncbi:hypothetical protein RXV86_10625 [Alisedimentitalea sp. MJ-SS2]|uniref:hypothetical protein n=1 Tax=Aliisedimentitalea sp. MJ-SS2 TaxID=3049795 RepID=UPI00291539C8|nr:hypothetical protein [Alisedimentitalea sp. MJ-SS2]MDU8927838.1 hypothetical protein [Alisedimentitalea sp. MJ-SS2]
METQQAIEPIVSGLRQALCREDISAQYRQWGGQLLERLCRPVRIVVAGLPGSGKSSLINMLVAQHVLGNTNAAPVIDLAYGPKPRIRFELEDGTIHRADGILQKMDVPLGVIRALQELPAPALQGQSYRELELDRRFEVSQRILEVALSEADIVLWCTNDFKDMEQALWANLPDEIKDHSFLVLAKADRKIMRGTLADTIRQLEPIVSEEFLGLYPVASIQGMTARTSGTGEDQHLWNSSGGKSLCYAIQHQVDSGRSADIDSAQMVLAKFGNATAAAAPPKPRSREVPSPLASAPAPVSAPAPTGETTSRPAEPAPARGPGAATDVLTQAVNVLSRSGQELLRELDGDAPIDTDTILNRCASSIATLSSQLGDTNSVDPALQDAALAAQDGEEMMILLRMERGEDAALDAVTLLLQMRKELTAQASA